MHADNTVQNFGKEVALLPLVVETSKVREAYAAAAGKGWVVPCFCSENLTTSEAVLSAVQDFAGEHGLSHVPVTLAITVRYAPRPQAAFYTHTRSWDTGLELFTADAAVLAATDGPFPDVDVMLHLDHVQHDIDSVLLSRDLSRYSSIMYDASTLPFEENIRKTAEFMAKAGGDILVEGACDEIFDAGGETHNALTTPEKAKRYCGETGIDMMVANLGTEHRASAQSLRYRGDAARRIRDAVGSRIVLHGLSSVPPGQARRLFGDGVCKVNIWTMLERDSSPALLREMRQNADKIAGPGALLSHFTTVYRQDIIFAEIKRIVRGFLDMWYV